MRHPRPGWRAWRRTCLALALASGLVPPEVQAQTRPADPPPRPAAPTPQSPPAARPFGNSGQARLPPTVSQPLSLGQPAATGQRSSEPAPIPNRGIEAPRDRFATGLAPSLEPMVLAPERRQGMTFGREHLRDAGPDRPFDNILPGARLRIPFE